MSSQLAGRRIPPMALLVRWADLENRPRIILSDSLDLVWSNEAADTMLAAGVDVRLAGDRLELVNAAEHEVFKTFIARTTGRVSAWCTPQADDSLLIFRAWRLDTDEAVGIGLVFHPSGDTYAPQWADFGRALGLTATEHKIALRLLDGVQIEAAAEEAGIALATARTHVRNLYLKLGVGSREAFFRVLAPFRIA